MRLAEVQEMAKEYEAETARLILEFESRTGTTVKRIELQHWNPVGEPTRLALNYVFSHPAAKPPE